MHGMTSISALQFAIFDIALGVCLAVHFGGAHSVWAELFSNEGAFADSHLNFTHGILSESAGTLGFPAFVTVLFSLLVLAIVFAIQDFFVALRRFCSGSLGLFI